MTTKAQITRRASEDGVSARTVERDYALSHLVAAIGALTGAPRLIFKGGTALRLCIFEEYRYSADLDFSIVDGTVSEAIGRISRSFGNVAGAISNVVIGDGAPPRISFVGPLGRERTVKLDLADDEIVTGFSRRPLVRRWADLPEGASIETYTPAELAGEKLRCVMQRLQCRDVYDLSALFESGLVDNEEVASVFRRKAEHRSLDPGAFPDRYRERLAQYAHRWKAELLDHVPGDVPGFEEIERRLRRHLKRAGLL